MTENNQPPECARCGEEYSMDFGMEPTKYCDECAHSRVEELEAENDQIRRALSNTLSILEEYAVQNPKWMFDGREQDPMGVHAALPMIRAALSTEGA